MSGVYCAVVKCTSSTNRNKELQFYDFPLDNISRCRLWINAAGRKDLLQITPIALLKGNVICGLHFKPSDFNNGKMKPSVVPTRHLNLERKRPKPRPARRAEPYPNTPRMRSAVSNIPSPSGDEPTPGPSQGTRSATRKTEKPNTRKTANNKE